MADQNDGLSVKGALLTAVILILVLVIGWHLLFPMLGIAVVVTATAWALIVATVTLFSLSILLFFIIPGMLVFVLCVIGFVWLLISLVLFPFLFPFLIPLFVIMLFVAFVRRRKKLPKED